MSRSLAGKGRKGERPDSAASSATVGSPPRSFRQHLVTHSPRAPSPYPSRLPFFQDEASSSAQPDVTAEGRILRSRTRAQLARRERATRATEFQKGAGQSAEQGGKEQETVVAAIGGTRCKDNWRKQN